MYFGYPLKCDCCGQFHKPESGAAWLCIHACDIPGEFGTEANRCKKCVDKYGSFGVDTKKYKAEMVTGIYA